MFKPPQYRAPLSYYFQRYRSGILALLVVIVVASVLGGFALYQHHLTPAGAVTEATPAWQCQHAAVTANPVKAENFCPGSNGWRVDRPTGPEHAIEGFTAPVSVNIGENVKIYVSTTAPTYTFQIYRMGWYQELGGRLVYSSPTLPGISQPPPIVDPATRMVSCDNWRDPVNMTVPATWVSGVYVVKLLSSAGYMRYASFVVRNDASHSAMLFQTSVLTYQAYNTWGGYSLYRGPNSNGNGEVTAANRAYVVSFDRPYDRSDGLGDFPMYSESDILRWVERMGYDVSYTTDVDTDMRGTLLAQHRLFMAVGHDEYWSTAMRNNVTTARDAGISLAFFGGNDVYWHVRLQNSPLGPDRELICYKPGYYKGGSPDPIASIDPREDTVLWRDTPINEPANALLGEMYGGGVVNGAPLVLAEGAAPLLAGTSLHVGSAFKDLVAGEYDRIYQNGLTPSSLTVVASSLLRCAVTTLCPANRTDTADATIYTAGSGARVFDAGTEFWGWGLGDYTFDPAIPAKSYSSPAFQQFTANLLAYLLQPPNP